MQSSVFKAMSISLIRSNILFAIMSRSLIPSSNWNALVQSSIWCMCADRYIGDCYIAYKTTLKYFESMIKSTFLSNIFFIVRVYLSQSLSIICFLYLISIDTSALFTGNFITSLNKFYFKKHILVKFLVIR